MPVTTKLKVADPAAANRAYAGCTNVMKMLSTSLPATTPAQAQIVGAVQQYLHETQALLDMGHTRGALESVDATLSVLGADALASAVSPVGHNRLIRAIKDWVRTPVQQSASEGPNWLFSPIRVSLGFNTDDEGRISIPADVTVTPDDATFAINGKRISLGKPNKLGDGGCVSIYNYIPPDGFIIAEKDQQVDPDPPDPDKKKTKLKKQHRIFGDLKVIVVTCPCKKYRFYAYVRKFSFYCECNGTVGSDPRPPGFPPTPDHPQSEGSGWALDDGNPNNQGQHSKDLPGGSDKPYPDSLGGADNAMQDTPGVDNPEGRQKLPDGRELKRVWPEFVELYPASAQSP